MIEDYEVTVVGGGPAGLTTALNLSRLGHDTAVLSRGGGRAAMVLDTHDVIGVSEDVRARSSWHGRPSRSTPTAPTTTATPSPPSNRPTSGSA